MVVDVVFVEDEGQVLIDRTLVVADFTLRFVHLTVAGLGRLLDVQGKFVTSLQIRLEPSS